MEKILITGANGMLGGKIIKRLVDLLDFSVIAVSSTEEKIQATIQRENIEHAGRIQFLANENLLMSNVDLSDVYGAVHLAFARRIRSAQDIAQSICYASAVFKKLSGTDISRVINLSSQGIYGNTEEYRTEETPPAPVNHYTMAKYATEIIFNMCFDNSGVRDYTSIRLDMVSQSQNLLPALCKQAIGGKIQLKGGEQRFSFIDAEDAAEGIVSMLLSSPKWEKVYNMGWDRCRYTLTEIADVVADVSEKFGYGRPEVILEKQDISLWSGMDSMRFMEHTGWKPEIELQRTIEKIFAELLNSEVNK